MNEFDPIAYLNEPRWRSVSLGLERIRKLLALLGNPQDHIPFVHVAGTNGKGSTSAFIAQILQCAGYKTGLFTSPYIIDFEERIQINRHNISLSDLRSVTLKVRDAAESMKEHPTEFELMTAVALLYFFEQHCDIAVMEVGLGGRLDSTNVIKIVEVSVITPIAFDHCAVLGDTLEDIAREKAGIIKQGVPVVSAPQKTEAMRVLKAVAQERKAFLRVVSDVPQGSNDNFSYGDWDHLALSLKGRYQMQNAALALEASRVLVEKGWAITETALRQGLKTAQWPGRFEVVNQAPPIIIDGAHNEQGIASLVNSLVYYYPHRPTVFVVGILEDKAYRDMLERLAPYGFAFVAVSVPNPRALSAAKLAETLKNILASNNLFVPVYCAQSVQEGLVQGMSLLPENGVLCVCGSLYSIKQVKQELRRIIG